MLYFPSVRKSDADMELCLVYCIQDA